MDFNSEPRQWVETVANRRVHGTANEQVGLQWEMDRLAMQPLNGCPPCPYSDDELRKAARDDYVSWQPNRYSVPWQYLGRKVWVRDQANQVRCALQYRVACRACPSRQKTSGAHRAIASPRHSLGATKGGKPSGNRRAIIALSVRITMQTVIKTNSISHFCVKLKKTLDYFGAFA
jgi:hypothetical protein